MKAGRAVRLQLGGQCVRSDEEPRFSPERYATAGDAFDLMQVAHAEGEL